MRRPAGRHTRVTPRPSHGWPAGSLADTISFFVISYLGLALSIGLAHLVHRRRHRNHSAVVASAV